MKIWSWTKKNHSIFLLGNTFGSYELSLTHFGFNYYFRSILIIVGDALQIHLNMFNIEIYIWILTLL